MAGEENQLTLDDVERCLAAAGRGDMEEVKRIVESRGLVWLEGGAVDMKGIEQWQAKEATDAKKTSEQS